MPKLDSATDRENASVKRGRGGESRPDPLRVLLAGCARQDQRAFERLYRLTAPKLFSLCLMLLRRRELAEEVLQEVFTQIWREAPRFEQYRATPMTWMTVMARNRAIDVLRRPSTAIQSFDADDQLHDDRRDWDPLSYAQRLDENEELRRCLERLGAQQRDAVLLAFFQGLTHSELSHNLDRPIGTVKSWVRRGLGQLKQCLEQ